MFYYPPTALYIQEGTEFTIDDVQYSANWLNLSTPEEKAALGLEEVIVIGSPANQTYYWVTETLAEATLTYTNTPKDLDQCKSLAISQVNSTAYSLLLTSDWMVTKQVETGTPVAPDWTAYREAVRTTANLAKEEYAACTTVDEIAAITIPWPEQPPLPQTPTPQE